MPEKKVIGKVKHFYDKISVAIIELNDKLKIGDKISIEGHDNVVEQVVDSMQIEHEKIEKAKAGDAVGLKTTGAVKENDKVFKVLE
ncbi:translation elongation factor-like protein [Candidatus Woesearchaeota archaeon]|nr:translation elongation factor-like protein [Candidatus Woesearchaeota archaeon]